MCATADNENDYVRNMKKSVREAALATRSSNTAQSQQDTHSVSDDGSEHFFVPLSGTGFSRVGPGPEKKQHTSTRSKQLFASEANTTSSSSDGINKYNESHDTFSHSNLDLLNDLDAININGFMSAAASNYAESEGRLSFYDVDETHDQVFSPPFLMEADSFEDLLGMNIF